jgi:hypothetical protein
MSTFKSYTDKEGNKVKIGDWVEVIRHTGDEVERIGKVARITNEVFSSLSVILEGNSSEYIFAKRTRKHISKEERTKL